MRIPSGNTDKYLYFVAVDSTDLKTRETGFSSFTVYRSRDGGAAAAMTTPTINETDTTNMPGVYELLVDEDTTIGAGNDSEEMVFHITHAGMAPVTRSVEIYRPKLTEGNTLDVTSTGAAGIDWGNIENKTTSNDLSGTDIQLCDTVTTLTGHTAQTGDNYARLGAPAGASVSADIADVDSDIAALNDISAADVNAQVSDVMKTDTMTQSSLCPQEAPPVNATIEEAIAYLYKAWRNKSTQTATTYSLFADDESTVDHKSTVSDDGTTATKGEVATGP